MTSSIIKFIVELLKNKLYIAVSIAYVILSVMLDTQVVVIAGTGTLFVMLGILEYNIFTFDELNTAINIKLFISIIGMCLIIQSMYINIFHAWITVLVLFTLIVTSFSLIVLGMQNINNLEVPALVIRIEKKCLSTMKTAVAA
jgi:hypothetical protein